MTIDNSRQMVSLSTEMTASEMMKKLQVEA